MRIPIMQSRRRLSVVDLFLMVFQIIAGAVSFLFKRPQILLGTVAVLGAGACLVTGIIKRHRRSGLPTGG